MSRSKLVIEKSCNIKLSPRQKRNLFAAPSTIAITSTFGPLDSFVDRFAQQLVQEQVDNVHINLKTMSYGILLCMEREPSSLEVQHLALLICQQRDVYASNKQAAAALLGSDQKDIPDDDKIELAAWTTFVQVLTNFDELIMRE
ncbi:hypothetical protein Mal52_37290 [Symmachiella dynata]|uniref:DUF1553 domain-containing protein n=1 Tax=Symmachiella dynata TaxID=2527995 RepID=A0A517ZRY4_9PLAN|nr:hypothetical protein [Symmachiella dynata]QDU45238.1 hypothetical protein Mal52_37290 [Symmachiella dynata]